MIDTQKSEQVLSAERIYVAKETFKPKRHGWSEYGTGWVKEMPGIGNVVVAPISWGHVQLDDGETNTLQRLSEIQKIVWDFKSKDTVPPNTLAIIEESGGVLLAAYDEKEGFTEEGWRGFILGYGSSNKDMVSHMLGIREEYRGGGQLGTQLKILQAHMAMKTGHHRMHWTYDPLRGVNASVNFSLGGKVSKYTVDKYGPLESGLYGPVPTDRFIVDWQFADPVTIKKINSISRGKKAKTTLIDIEPIRRVNGTNLESALSDTPSSLRYQIPGDIDQLMDDDKESAIKWRRDMNIVMRKLLDTNIVAEIPENNDPALLGVVHSQGNYMISEFVTEIVNNERQSYYVLTRKSND